MGKKQKKFNWYDKDAVLEQVRRHPLTLEKAPDSMRNDKEVALEAVGSIFRLVYSNSDDDMLGGTPYRSKYEGKLFQHVGATLRKNREFLVKAIREGEWFHFKLKR